MRDSRETLIRLDHDTGEAQIWTINRAVKGRAKRCGWRVEREQAGGTWYIGPIAGILIRKGRKRAGSGATGANLRKGKV